ncbi:MAG: hypothetical protein FDX02_04635 [Chlorobium sp.]|nr:MAG: hypothetical protein FDX02_04635 [Chlorobium sp.]
MTLISRETPVLLLCRAALSFSWMYQGAVPKIVCRSGGEIELIGHIIPDYQWACQAVFWMGVAEILFGLFLLVTRWRGAFWINVAALIGLLFFVALFEPTMFTLPFNPLTLNVALIALSVIAAGELKTSQTRISE